MLLIHKSDSEGKMINKKEKAFYATLASVGRVLWQPKAWANTRVSMETLDILEEFCRAEGILDQWKLINLDNLDGQVDPAFRTRLTELKFRPVYVSSQLTAQQNVNDGGVGKTIVDYFHHFKDDWVDVLENLETREEGGLSASEKRVLATRWMIKAHRKLVGSASGARKLYKTFRHQGFLLTADKSEDEFVRPQEFPKDYHQRIPGVSEAGAIVRAARSGRDKEEFEGHGSGAPTAPKVASANAKRKMESSGLGNGPAKKKRKTGTGSTKTRTTGQRPTQKRASKKRRTSGKCAGKKVTSTKRTKAKNGAVPAVYPVFGKSKLQVPTRTQKKAAPVPKKEGDWLTGDELEICLRWLEGSRLAEEALPRLPPTTFLKLAETLVQYREQGIDGLVNSGPMRNKELGKHLQSFWKKPFFCIINVDDNESAGIHWILALVSIKGRRDMQVELYDPLPRRMAINLAHMEATFTKMIPEATLHIKSLGYQDDGWRCGYFCLWWALWIIYLVQRKEDLPTLTLSGSTQDLEPTLEWPNLPDNWPKFVCNLLNTAMLTEVQPRPVYNRRFQHVYTKWKVSQMSDVNYMYAQKMPEDVFRSPQTCRALT
jgi:hypothetical protein